MTHEDWCIINKELEAVQMALAGLSARVLAIEKEKEEQDKADEELSKILVERWK